jgi:hypothetical protein
MAEFSVNESGDITQGSVVSGVNWGYEDDAQSLSIVLSNACNIEHGKADFLIVAELVDAKETITSSLEYKNLLPENGASPTKNQSKGIRSLLERYIHNKAINRYYFIEPGDLFKSVLPPLLVDFQHIQSIPMASLEKLDVICNLPTPYREQMMLQFSGFTSRVPVDRNPNIEELIRWIVDPINLK